MGWLKSIAKCLLVVFFMSNFHMKETEEPVEDPTTYMESISYEENINKAGAVKERVKRSVQLPPSEFVPEVEPFIEAIYVQSVLNQLLKKSPDVAACINALTFYDIRQLIVGAYGALVYLSIDPMQGVNLTALTTVAPTTTTTATTTTTPIPTTTMTTTTATTTLPPTTSTTTTPPTTTLPPTTPTTTTSPTTTSTGTPATTAPVNLTYALQKLLEKSFSKTAGPEIIDSLSSLTTSAPPGGYSDSQVQLILSILGNFTNNALQSHLKFEAETVKNMVSIGGQVANSISSPDLTVQLLQSMENVFSSMKATDIPFQMANGDLVISCVAFYPHNLTEESKLDLLPGAAVSLPAETIKQSSGGVINVISMFYGAITGSVEVPFNNSDDLSYFMAGPIRTNVAIVNNTSDHSLHIYMNFTCIDRMCDETTQCVFRNFITNEWSSEGCNTTVINGTAYCACNHLTSFSILMADSIPQGNNAPQLLDIITKILLPISIGSLLNCIAIEILLITQVSNSVALYRHICIIHIAVFLLLSNVSFLASSLFDVTANRFWCIALTFVTHFSLLAFFTWTMVQGLFLVCRLIFVFHHITKKEFLVLCVVLGYLCPAAIAGGTFVVYYPNRYLKSNACWLDSTYGASLLFNIPAMVIMGGNIFILVIVISKVLKPSISEGESEDDEVVRKLMKAVLFCTPQFGLTWALGIPMYFYPQATFLHYLFAMLNPLQGFFVLVFGCLLDKKVIETLKEFFNKNSSSSSMHTKMSNST